MVVVVCKRNGDIRESVEGLDVGLDVVDSSLHSVCKFYLVLRHCVLVSVWVTASCSRDNVSVSCTCQLSLCHVWKNT